VYAPWQNTPPPDSDDRRALGETAKSRTEYFRAT